MGLGGFARSRRSRRALLAVLSLRSDFVFLDLGPLWLFRLGGRGPDPKGDEAQAGVHRTHNSSVLESVHESVRESLVDRTRKMSTTNSSQPCLVCTRGVTDTMRIRRKKPTTR